MMMQRMKMRTLTATLGRYIAEHNYETHKQLNSKIITKFNRENTSSLTFIAEFLSRMFHFLSSLSRDVVALALLNMMGSQTFEYVSRARMLYESPRETHDHHHAFSALYEDVISSRVSGKQSFLRMN